MQIKPYELFYNSEKNNSFKHLLQLTTDTPVVSSQVSFKHFILILCGFFVGIYES